MIWETVYSATRTFDIPGETSRIQSELWELLKKLHRKRFWWGGRKMTAFALRHLGEGAWEVTIKVRRTDKPLGQFWREVEQEVARLRADEPLAHHRQPRD